MIGHISLTLFTANLSLSNWNTQKKTFQKTFSSNARITGATCSSFEYIQWLQRLKSFWKFLNYNLQNLPRCLACIALGWQYRFSFATARCKSQTDQELEISFKSFDFRSVKIFFEECFSLQIIQIFAQSPFLIWHKKTIKDWLSKIICSNLYSRPRRTFKTFYGWIFYFGSVWVRSKYLNQRARHFTAALARTREKKSYFSRAFQCWEMDR